jgi:hypothetical protein
LHPGKQMGIGENKGAFLLPLLPSTNEPKEGTQVSVLFDSSNQQAEQSVIIFLSLQWH